MLPHEYQYLPALNNSELFPKSLLASHRPCFPLLKVRCTSYHSLVWVPARTRAAERQQCQEPGGLGRTDHAAPPRELEHADLRPLHAWHLLSKHLLRSTLFSVPGEMPLSSCLLLLFGGICWLQNGLVSTSEQAEEGLLKAKYADHVKRAMGPKAAFHSGTFKLGTPTEMRAFYKWAGFSVNRFK